MLLVDHNGKTPSYDSFVTQAHQFQCRQKSRQAKLNIDVNPDMCQCWSQNKTMELRLNVDLNGYLFIVL